MDNSHSKIAVVIPAYNVEDTIVKVIMGIPTNVHNIIVVNDASKDDTVARVKTIKDHRVTLIN
ncbi:MAG: hypothetical protein ACD_35C00137G0002, partial [uncultured bacterium]